MEVHLGYCVLTLKYDAFEKLEKNSFDKSIKMASMMTQKYVRTVKKWDNNFCNSIMCKLIE